MPEFGPNTLTSPYEIEDARAAERKASEHQRDLANALAKAHGDLADAEFRYKRACSDRTKELHVNGIPTGPSEGKGLAITTCENITKGEESIALLRRERDERKGDVKSAEKECFRAGDDRKALRGLVQWSMHIALRTDAPPADWDRQTGELRSAA